MPGGWLVRSGGWCAAHSVGGGRRHVGGVVSPGSSMHWDCGSVCRLGYDRRGRQTHLGREIEMHGCASCRCQRTFSSRSRSACGRGCRHGRSSIDGGGARGPSGAQSGAWPVRGTAGCHRWEDLRWARERGYERRKGQGEKTRPWGSQRWRDSAWYMMANATMFKTDLESYIHVAKHCVHYNNEHSVTHMLHSNASPCQTTIDSAQAWRTVNCAHPILSRIPKTSTFRSEGSYTESATFPLPWAEAEISGDGAASRLLLRLVPPIVVPFLPLRSDVLVACCPTPTWASSCSIAFTDSATEGTMALPSILRSNHLQNPNRSVCPMLSRSSTPSSCSSSWQHPPQQSYIRRLRSAAASSSRCADSWSNLSCDRYFWMCSLAVWSIASSCLEVSLADVDGWGWSACSIAKSLARCLTLLLTASSVRCSFALRSYNFLSSAVYMMLTGLAAMKDQAKGTDQIPNAMQRALKSTRSVVLAPALSRRMPRVNCAITSPMTE